MTLSPSWIAQKCVLIEGFDCKVVWGVQGSLGGPGEALADSVVLQAVGAGMVLLKVTPHFLTSTQHSAPSCLPGLNFLSLGTTREVKGAGGKVSPFWPAVMGNLFPFSLHLQGTSNRDAASISARILGRGGPGSGDPSI